MSEKVKGYITKLFIELDKEVKGIVQSSFSSAATAQNITEYVSSKIAAASQGYIFDLYSELSKKTLSEDIFQDPANANKFYALNMRQKIIDAYRFDIRNLQACNAKINFKEINRTNTSAGAALGSAAVTGIILSAATEVSTAAVLAGAVLVGIVGGTTTYFKIVPEKNQENFLHAVHKSLDNLQKELLRWVDDIERFYQKEIDELRRTL